MKPRTRRDLHQQNRESWNAATQIHNTHKRDQATWLREGGELLFTEELELLGELDGRELVHLQCNSGQDSLCLARRGARVTGVDISDAAVDFARELATATAIPAAFERADVYDWLTEAAAAGRQFDLAFASYGWMVWLSDLNAWARGVADVLRPGGAVILLEFHPVAALFDEQLRLSFDYFAASDGEVVTWDEGVGDYVGASGEALAPSGFVPGEAEVSNPHACHEFFWTIADVIGALRAAGLEIERFEEWPYTNGCRMFDEMILRDDADGRRFELPAGRPRLPLMFGLRARKPATAGGISMFVLDAFTDELFSGNPAAVVPLDIELPASTMQRIAAENNLSETAFLRGGDGSYAIRWFTPAAEVPLCGHATLASAHVVLELLEPGRDRVEFSSASGPLIVTRDPDDPDALVMDFPADPPRPEPAPDGLFEALGARPRELLRASYWLAVFATEAEVRALAPDFRALAGIFPGQVIATAPADDPELDFVSRFFAPGVGIDEDPVTGSAHCILAPYWSPALGKRRMRARQVSARGGAIACELADRRVRLVGRCVRYAKAKIELGRHTLERP